MANTYISRSISASPTNPDKFTISMWVKRCKLGAEQSLMGQYASSNFRGKLSFLSDDRIEYIQKNDGNTTANLITTRKFGDTFGYYHLLVQFDTSQGTDSNRIKIYINGTQETAFDTSSYPAQNLDMRLNQASGTLCIGQDGNGGNYCDLILSHVHLVDGATEAPTVFGETDNTTGEWKIKPSPTISEYGDDGFFVLKDGNSLTDQSGKGNNFTLGGGTLTKTEDCPSNVFCTMNPLDKSSSLSLSYGNNRTASPSNSWMPCKATLGMVGQNGKFYWEGKCESGTNHYFGVYDASGTIRGSSQSDMDGARFVYTYAGSIERTITGQSGIGSGTYATFVNNDDIGVALDKENGTITFYKNGTQIYTETHSSLQTKDLIPGTQAYGSDIQWNFGNGAFGNTQLTGTTYQGDGNLGIFKYQPPSGYTALCTKGLNL